MATKKTVWCNPDWSKARSYLAPEDILCFGLGCPTGQIKKGERYTLHRIKASGAYVDRAFCLACHPIREMPAGFDPWDKWQQDMANLDREWIHNNPDKLPAPSGMVLISKGEIRIL